MASHLQNDPVNKSGRLGKIYKAGLAVLLTGVIAAGTISVFAPAVSTPAIAEKQVPQSHSDIQLSYAPLVKSTSGAVVNVYAGRKVQQRSPFAGDPFFEQFFGGQMRPNKPRLEQSLGSGVIVDSSGLIVTNNHVIDGADDIKVALADGREFSSKLLLNDVTTDLAILKIDAKEELPTIKLADSDKVEVGDLVLAIGNPFGVGQTVTSGIVSAQSRTQVGVSDFDFFIQTDAAINPGNSGGALIDMNGNLIGINTAIYSRSGGSVGIGFAIPSNMVSAVVKSAESGSDTFERPYVGATFQAITPDIAAGLGLRQPSGALITDLAEKSPAAEAGIQVGDVITAIDGVKVDNPDALAYRVSTAGIGKTVQMTVLNDGKSREVAVTLAQPPKEAPAREVTGRNPLAGAQVQNITPELARKSGLAPTTRGVVISGVKNNTPAQAMNLKAGDIVRGVNGTAIANVDDLLAVLSAGRSALWRLDIERDGVIYRQFVR
ncbi:DegQ family serine endoprotease [Pseudochrobactrum sp. AO18b]|uniref:DegQ family serine endoprotease n=1 Tax=Pseudochrobactrum sp. AO18b TaxID=1201036 RepID=UPI00039F3640|nr:DegQ family serine endoprotease [Pseudochrobactrum sp. AO18b]